MATTILVLVRHRSSEGGYIGPITCKLIALDKTGIRFECPEYLPPGMGLSYQYRDKDANWVNIDCPQTLNQQTPFIYEAKAS